MREKIFNFFILTSTAFSNVFKGTCLTHSSLMSKHYTTEDSRIKYIFYMIQL